MAINSGVEEFNTASIDALIAAAIWGKVCPVKISVVIFRGPLGVAILKDTVLSLSVTVALATLELTVKSPVLGS